MIVHRKQCSPDAFSIWTPIPVLCLCKLCLMLRMLWKSFKVSQLVWRAFKRLPFLVEIFSPCLIRSDLGMSLQTVVRCKFSMQPSYSPPSCLPDFQARWIPCLIAPMFQTHDSCPICIRLPWKRLHLYEKSLWHYCSKGSGLRTRHCSESDDHVSVRTVLHIKDSLCSITIFSPFVFIYHPQKMT
jgi:hypothetical protein